MGMLMFLVILIIWSFIPTVLPELKDKTRESVLRVYLLLGIYIMVLFILFIIFGS